MMKHDLYYAIMLMAHTCMLFGTGDERQMSVQCDKCLCVHVCVSVCVCVCVGWVGGGGLGV